MEIQLLRSATIIVRSGEERVLVDPCLCNKGRLPPYTFFRKRPRMNPLVDLPANAVPALEGVTAGLVTHCRGGHWDHLDGPGARFLAKKKVPVWCSPGDESFLQKRGMETRPVPAGEGREFLGGRIRTVKTAHGRGLAGWLMGPGVGYCIEMPGEPRLYIAGDTVLTAGVRRVLEDFRPEVSVVNAGCAVLDFGSPILMPVDEVLEFVNLAPGRVVAVHMDAFNHCATSREILRRALESSGLAEKVLVPEDGETIQL